MIQIKKIYTFLAFISGPVTLSGQELVMDRETSDRL